MTESYAGSPSPDDIDDTLDSPTARLSRQADAILAQADAEARPFARTTSVRQAVRDDLAQGRQWSGDRAERAREAITDKPLKATLYALGVGVLIGVLLRR